MKVKVFNRHGALTGPSSHPRRKDRHRVARAAHRHPIPDRAGKAPSPRFAHVARQPAARCIHLRVLWIALFASPPSSTRGPGASFFQPVAAENVRTQEDRAMAWSARDPMRPLRCPSGHVFADGPVVSGLRYCVNSDSLVFTEEKDLFTLADPAPTRAHPRVVWGRRPDLRRPLRSSSSLPNLLPSGREPNSRKGDPAK